MTKGSTLYAATSIAPTHKSNVDIDRPPQLFVDRGAALPAPLQFDSILDRAGGLLEWATALQLTLLFLQESSVH